MSKKRICSLDIESNGLLDQLIDFSSFPYKLNKQAKLWTVVVTDFDTKKSVFAENENITKEWFKKTLEPYNVIVAHNGHKFDLLALQLFGVLEYKIGWFGKNDICFGREVRFFDSLILSRLFDPNRYGGHSLQSWGERIGNFKDDYRQQCIEKGYIDKNSPKGEEFKAFNDLLTPYCIQDTLVTIDAFKSLLKEWGSYKNWEASVRQEHILADVSIKREVLGFSFDKELALENLEKLTTLIDEAREKVNPFLPPKPMNKGELKYYTPPKVQLTKGGTPSANMIKFVEKVGGKLKFLGDGEYEFEYEEKVFKVPFTSPIKTHTEASIEDLDHVKETLINEFGWIPTEWRMRDLTKDSKKQSLTLEKRQNATTRWLKETSEGKFKRLRVEGALKDFKLKNPNDISTYLLKAIEKDAPVKIRTSPSIKVGVERELCPNLIKLGDKVAFAKYFADYLTYRNRKSAIAGGDTEDMDFDEDIPNTGYLSMYREVDGRIPTPAIEIGAISNRYRHIGVVNIPRVTSLFGEEMRRLFGCGEGFVQLGFDYASLENRVQGHYVFPYKGGKELAESLVAEKPNDLHSINSRKMGIDRGSAKSVGYGILYGCNYKKLMEMLGVDDEKALEIYNSFWDAVPALKSFKEDLERQWEVNNKEFIFSIDGRKILTRSRHSLLNFLFQSSGVVIAKYATIFIMEDLERRGLCIDPFVGRPDVKNIIDYHDENQLVTNPSLIKYKIFSSKEEGEEFIKNWDFSKGQLSALTKGKEKYFVALPNVVSISIENAIKRVEQMLNTNVNFGMEWIVGRNWADCH